MIASRDTIAAMLVAMLAWPGALLAQDANAELAQRVDQLERLVNSQGLIELLNELDRSREEVRILRGELEQQKFELQRLQERQRDFFADTDRRLTLVESAPAPGGGTLAAIPANPPLATLDETGNAVADESATLTPETTVTGADPAAAEANYRAAFDKLKAGQYEVAIADFSQFLGAYPGSEYADNAQYWLGEAYYVTREFETAITEYRKLVDQYPQSQKVTHALLKIGYSQHELGDSQRALQTLEELTVRFPGTTAARLADERIRAIKVSPG